MNKRPKPYSKLLLVAGIVTVTIIACKKDGHDQPHYDLPSVEIAESDNLGIPSEISFDHNLPKGTKRLATFFAVGVQKYKAQVKAGSNPVKYEWVFVAPQADLYDITNKKVGTHTAGPTWQLSPNDSIYAQAYNPPKTALATLPNSIDWLLLKPKDGKTPTGIFAGTEYIQRIDTQGGAAPSTLPKNLSETVEVPYTAIYRFSKRN
jgi:hypothetical protein